ncbi:MAG: hypothetical protein BRD47_00010 [Bacteroidetes bacterium QS_8_68_28]|nr:MAG: hypothetical protein BRD47_00010 [Bacteroidetes bacterium QS_8_68_28]
MSAETESASREQTSSAAAAPEVASEESEPQEAEDARYASQAAAAQPSPVAFEGGAAAPSELGGTTERSEWVFLLLAVFFSLALVAIPAVFFTSIDLTAPAEEGGGGGAPESSEEARELERLQLLRETRANALSKLYTYGPSEDVARYRIPIERAMRLTLRQDTSAAAPAASRPARGELAAPPGSALRSMTPR